MRVRERHATRSTAYEARGVAQDDGWPAAKGAETARDLHVNISEGRGGVLLCAQSRYLGLASPAFDWNIEYLYVCLEHQQSLLCYVLGMGSKP